MRSYVKSGALQAIRDAGGEVFGITSEPHTLAAEAAATWENDFETIGDPHQELRDVCAERGWVEVFNNPDAGHLFDRPWACHPKGYYQPAVLAVSREGRVLYRWRCVPSHKNMSGAGARPEAMYTWHKIKEALADERGADAAPDRDPKMGAKDVSWFRFMLLMTAHGWFIRPKALPLAREGDPKRVGPTAVMRRLYGFAALWVVLLIALPFVWVAGLALLWGLVLMPGMVAIHRQFQNEPDPY